jgi:hypothetical protein
VDGVVIPLSSRWHASSGYQDQLPAEHQCLHRPPAHTPGDVGGLLYFCMHALCQGRLLMK